LVKFWVPQIQGLEKFPAFYRDACVPFGLPLAKDLCKLRQDLSRVVLVDNSKKSFWLQPDNGLLVSDWGGTNFSDRELTRVKQDLLDLLDLEDVRPALRSKSADASPGSLGDDLPLVIILAIIAAAFLLSNLSAP
jgi:hypothetical protein